MSDDRAPRGGPADPRPEERAKRAYRRRIDCAEAPPASEVRETAARDERVALSRPGDTEDPCGLSRGEPLHASP